jgi:RNA polymerase-binding transcription factor DksA
MGKRTTKSKAARAKQGRAEKARPSKSKVSRPAARKAKKVAPKKTARKAKPKAPRRRTRPAPSAAPRGKKAVRKGRVPQTTEQVAARRSHAVKKLLALKAEKTEPAPRKEGFLIKAPKKAKQQENLAAAPRFVRRPTAPKPVEPEKAAPQPRKVVLRKKDIDELHQALDAERQRLIAQLNALDEVASLTGPSEVNENVPGYSIHLAEYASENQVVETTLAQRVLQTERLAEIEDALRRIGQPGFGICQNCGSPIGLERLKVKPSAEFCVPCRQMKEQGRI